MDALQLVTAVDRSFKGPFSLYSTSRGEAGQAVWSRSDPGS